MSKKVIIASSRRDKHNTIIRPSALEGARDQINGERGVKVTIDHNLTIPPLGQIANAETVIDVDGETLLIAEYKYFDETFSIKLEDGEELKGERFSDGGRPFNCIEKETLENVEILVDLTNFGNNSKSLSLLENKLKEDTEFQFTMAEFGRKSEIPDPEIIIKLTPEVILCFFGSKFFTKFIEKAGERMGNISQKDMVNFYGFVKNAAVNITSLAVPKLRPITYIFKMSGDINIELVITTRNPDIVANGLKKELLAKVAEKIQSLTVIPDIEKIQFTLNELNEWEFNYLLTAKGEVIGTKKSYSNRTKFINGLGNQRLINPN